MNPLAWQYRELVQGLHALKPKKRGNPVSWIVLSGCAFVIGGLGFDASVREAIFSPPAQHGPAFSVPAPNLPAKLPAGVTPQSARVAMPVIVVPPPQAVAAAVAPPPPVDVVPPATAAAADQDDGPLPHAKAHNTAPTKRAHSGKRHK